VFVFLPEELKVYHSSLIPQN
jgi:hypothetical protein